MVQRKSLKSSHKDIEGESEQQKGRHALKRSGQQCQMQQKGAVRLEIKSVHRNVLAI